MSTDPNIKTTHHHYDFFFIHSKQHEWISSQHKNILAYQIFIVLRFKSEMQHICHEFKIELNCHQLLFF